MRETRYGSNTMRPTLDQIPESVNLRTSFSGRHYKILTLSTSSSRHYSGRALYACHVMFGGETQMYRPKPVSHDENGTIKARNAQRSHHAMRI